MLYTLIFATTLLWNNIETGMSRSDVERLYPAGDHVAYKSQSVELDNVAITDRCKAEVTIRFDAGSAVRDVVVSGNPAYGGRCAKDVMALLSAKYGQPASLDDTGGSLFARRGKISIWQRDGVALRFKDFSGGGIAMASWQLVYTPAAADLSL